MRAAEKVVNGNDGCGTVSGGEGNSLERAAAAVAGE